MPLLLSHQDLRPLFAEPLLLDRLFDAIADAYCHPPPPEEGGRRRWLETPLGADGTLRVFPSASDRHGTTLLIDPSFTQLRREPDPSRLVVLHGPDGRLRALLPGDALYALHIAVPTAVATRALATPNARVLAMMGTGYQATAHLPMLLHALPTITEIRAWSPTAANRAAFAQTMAARLGRPVLPMDTAREAVEGSDVIAATSSASRPVFEADWVRPGALVASIARDQIPVELLSRARVFASEVAAFRGRGGRTIPDPNRVLSPLWDQVEPAGELADVLQGRVPARERPDDVVLFNLMSLPGTDAALVEAVVTWAEQHSVGTPFHFA